MLGLFTSRMVVVSGGASCADDRAGPISAAAPADASVARKRRRLCIIDMANLLRVNLASVARRDADQPLSSSLSSLKKRQSVPCEIILLGADLIIPASRSRRA